MIAGLVMRRTTIDGSTGSKARLSGDQKVRCRDQPMEQQLEPRQFFEQVTAAACVELFGRYGVPVRRADESDEPIRPEFFLCSVIGFTGRDLRGTMLLALTEELSGLSNPVSGASANLDPAARRVIQRDWVGELSNQLLGQVKLELLRCGVEIYMNLPAVLLGQHLAPLPRADLKPLKFTLAKGAAAVWMEIEARPGFKIDDRPSSAPGPAPGDALLFD
jgi:CheY-specific phosphatase CheX